MNEFSNKFNTNNIHEKDINIVTRALTSMFDIYDIARNDYHCIILMTSHNINECTNCNQHATAYPSRNER